ncbi:MAG: coenzyme F420-0:L-glutamate ligase [Clostridia bacterium]|nr:coenzyme F420-0:L-glutamate ligase [Clostridia bacterium]
MAEMLANEGKNLVIEVDGKSYQRIPIKTKVVGKEDTIPAVAKEFAAEHMQEGDILFISEKCVACTQERAIPMKDIHPSPLAKLLSKFVYKSPYGIGLSIPETMEMALRECGTIKILWAAFWSALGKMVGKRGIFYDIAGPKARSIDGPCDCTLPPYNEYVVLGPADPDGVAKETAAAIGHKVAIIDVNDIDGVILGVSDPSMDKAWLVRVLKDNPLGQSRQQTPMGIIREI